MMLFPFPGSTLDLNTSRVDFRFLSIIFMHFGRRVCSRKEKIGYKSIFFKRYILPFLAAFGLAELFCQNMLIL
jgi:hypothetical protein